MEEELCYKVDKLIDRKEISFWKEEDGRIFINYPSISGRKETIYYSYNKKNKVYEFNFNSFDENYKGVDITDFLVEELNISYQDAEEIEEYILSLAQK